MKNKYFITFYRVAKGNLDFLKNMLLLKNPQFLPNQYETLSKKRYLWVPYFDKVLQWSGKNCGFFNKSIFLRKSKFPFATLYFVYFFGVSISIGNIPRIFSVSSYLQCHLFYYIFYQAVRLHFKMFLGTPKKLLGTFYLVT